MYLQFYKKNPLLPEFSKTLPEFEILCGTSTVYILSSASSFPTISVYATAQGLISKKGTMQNEQMRRQKMIRLGRKTDEKRRC